MKKTTALFLLLGTLCICTTTAFSQEKTIDYYTTLAPFAMPKVTVPTFPDKYFPITDNGAVGDGHTLNTTAFSKAITACANAGGGHVVVPAGIWLTGPIQLLSNVDLHVERGAIILFSGDFTQYPMTKASPASTSIVTTPPISGYGLKNVAITGEGIIDGNGEYWRPVKKEKMTAAQWKTLLAKGGQLSKDEKIWWPSEEAMNGEQFLKTLKAENPKAEAADYLPARVFLRPNLVHLANCENILVEDITLRNSPKFVFYPTNCTNVTIKGATIFNEWWAQNGDGIDISACTNVVVYRCNVSVGDDGICMKSSGGGKKDNPAEPNLKNVLVAECTVYHGHGGFVIGSNTDGGIENVFVKNCNFIGTDIGVRVKSNAGRGGLVKNIFIENIFMKDIVGEAILFDTYYDDVPAGADSKAVKNVRTDKTPEFTDFYFKHIYCTNAETALFFRGLPEQPIHNIHIEESVFSAKDIAFVEKANQLFLKKVKLVDKDPSDLHKKWGFIEE